ncbi:MAG: hypothetical protein KIT09_00225 [Bryobacteraceae bacterium]|nr:hypothetical protein [Bryobacteraceae bacterium]
MPDKQDSVEVKEYAGGWISERKNTDVPGFLKLSYIVIAAGCIAYFFLYMNGEVTHSTRGRLVEQLNSATQGSDAFMYVVTAMAVVFAVIVVRFAFKKRHE